MAQSATRDVSINIRARNVMLDQTFFGLEAKTFERFRALVDRPLPPRSRASLKRLLARKTPWKS
jgi:uncharacterized protein (DUF1778 family)